MFYFVIDLILEEVEEVLEDYVLVIIVESMKWFRIMIVVGVVMVFDMIDELVFVFCNVGNE